MKNLNLIGCSGDKGSNRYTPALDPHLTNRHTCRDHQGIMATYLDIFYTYYSYRYPLILPPGRLLRGITIFFPPYPIG